MRTLKGFVCVAVTRGTWERHILFGAPKENTTRYTSSSLATNGLKFFDSLEEANIAGKRLARQAGFKEVSIAEIEMVVSQSREDLESSVFQESKSLIIIWHLDGFIELAGRMVAGRPAHNAIGIANLWDNGLAPIQNVKDAENGAMEASRQSDGAKVEIATFNLAEVF